MATTWPRLAERDVMTPVIGAGTTMVVTIWLGLVRPRTCSAVSPSSWSRSRAASTSVAWASWAAVISSRSWRLAAPMSTS